MNLTCTSITLRHDDKVDVEFGTPDDDGRLTITASIPVARMYEVGSEYAFDDDHPDMRPNPLDVEP